MWESLRLAWADDDLRARLRFILLVFGVYVLGAHVPVPIPGIDQAQLVSLLEENPFFSLMNTIGGGALSRISIFALGLGPYIIASIIVQVMTMATPKWKEEMKEGGEYARRQQNRRTRVLTLGLCVFQGLGLLQLMGPQVTAGLQPWDRAFIVVFWTAGAMFMLWLGEQLSEKGIGNGVSILIFAGIVISLPSLGSQVGEAVTAGIVQWWQVIAVLILFAATTWGIVYFTVAQRRIPIQHMRRNFGNRQIGAGQTSYLPVAVGMAGVIPIIFAITLIYIPAQFAAAFPPDGQIHQTLMLVAEYTSPDFTRPSGYLAALVYAGLIFFFTYFWTALQYNVEDIADNLKRGGSYIQGIRPGQQTRKFLDGVISRVTFIGAVFLAMAAMTQFIMPLIANVQNLGLIGGTSLLIMVSVALETMRQIEANLITKQYEG